jgi:hypothetical protein
MFSEGVHRLLLCGEIPGTYRGESLCDIEYQQVYQGDYVRPTKGLAQLEAALPTRSTRSATPKTASLALGSKVADLRIEDSQNLAERKLQ